MLFKLRCTKALTVYDSTALVIKLKYSGITIKDGDQTWSWNGW